MTINIDTTIKSPNYSSRNGQKIFMLVMHATAGRKDSDLHILTDDTVPLKKRVSVLYYILKTGHVYQLVDDSYAAWHAGKAYWNQYGPVEIQEGSIGIELENLNNGIDPYPPEQYNAALELSKALVSRYNITQNNIVTHANIAGITEGKTDPKGFPFDKFKSDILYGKWGDSYPLPEDQRGYGIPSSWANTDGTLGQAESPPLYYPSGGPNAGMIAYQFFRGGLIIYDSRINRTVAIIRFPVKLITTQ